MTLLRLASKTLATGSNARQLSAKSAYRSITTMPEFASCNPWELGQQDSVHEVLNCVGGVWTGETKAKIVIPHPLDRDAPPIFTIPDTQVDELEPFYKSLRAVPKTGLHNPLKNPERYVEVSAEVSELIPIMVCFTLLLTERFSSPGHSSTEKSRER